MEIERKFLLSALADELPDGPWTPLRQGYLASGEGGEVRLRDAGGALTLTVKSGVGLVREEREIELSPAQFEALWPLTQGRRIEKRRAVIPAAALIYEIDRFEGALAGLAIAEVEFGSVEDAEAFEPPAWFGAEVTGDVRYTNAVLALYGLPGGAPR